MRGACPECGAALKVIPTLPGRTVEHCPACDDNKKRAEAAARMSLHLCGLDEWLRTVGVPPIYWRASLADYADEYDIRRSYFVTGPAGRGKTHLACAILRERYLLGGPERVPYARFATVPNLIAKMRGVFTGSSETQETVIKRYSSVSILVLDDLGADDEPTAFVREVVHAVLDNRLSARLQTIVTSNKTLEEIGTVFHDRISSRLVGMAGDDDGVVIFPDSMPDRRMRGFDGKAAAAGDG